MANVLQGFEISLLFAPAWIRQT